MQRNTKNGKIVHEGFFLSPEELAAYAMPFNYASEVDQISSMQGVMRFPASVSEFKSDDVAAISRIARAFWGDQWNGQSFMAISHGAPIINC